jgi:hypothetical protein
MYRTTDQLKTVKDEQAAKERTEASKQGLKLSFINGTVHFESKSSCGRR